MRRELLASGAPDGIVDDAVLVLSELLSNSYRHARPLGPDAEQGNRAGQQHGKEQARHRGRERGSGSQAQAPQGSQDAQDYQDHVRAAWCRKSNGELTISVTDGGGPTRPLLSTPSVTARGGRGLSIITSLSKDWGVTEEDDFDGVTVWVVLTLPNGFTACPPSAVNGRAGANGRAGSVDGRAGAVNGRAGAVNGRSGRRGQSGANGKHLNGKAALDLVGFDDLA